MITVVSGAHKMYLSKYSENRFQLVVYCMLGLCINLLLLSGKWSVLYHRHCSDEQTLQETDKQRQITDSQV